MVAESCVDRLANQILAAACIAEFNEPYAVELMKKTHFRVCQIKRN